jgi:hypothetical protein
VYGACDAERFAAGERGGRRRFSEFENGQVYLRTYAGLAELAGGADRGCPGAAGLPGYGDWLVLAEGYLPKELPPLALSMSH